MQWKNTPQHYGLVSKLLHWLVAVLIIGLIWLGWYMVDLTYYDTWYNDSLLTHKALGLLVLVLGVGKICWTLGCGTPGYQPSIKSWQRLAARLTHLLLFAMMIALPVSGYLISTSNGDGVSIFGWFEVPALATVDESLRDSAIDWHYYLAYATGAIVLLHALAALQHQFIERDGTLRRMLF